MRAVNLITIYRIVTAPLLLGLVIAGHLGIFKWLLTVSFLTDAVDGIIARKSGTVSILGSRLDSLGDDLTFAVAVIGLGITRPIFILEQWMIVAALLALFFIQLFMALIKYKRISSFHTYLAKMAAMLQAVFLISVFFLEDICYPLFYAAGIVTALDLLEEIALVLILPRWETDVKGWYWVANRKS